jgi:hypothetical protein
MAAEKGEQPLGPDGKVEPAAVIALGPGKPQEGRRVNEGR